MMTRSLLPNGSRLFSLPGASLRWQQLIVLFTLYIALEMMDWFFYLYESKRVEGGLKA